MVRTPATCRCACRGTLPTRPSRRSLAASAGCTGLSIRRIADQLNTEQIPAKRRGAWHPTTVARVPPEDHISNFWQTIVLAVVLSWRPTESPGPLGDVHYVVIGCQDLAVLDDVALDVVPTAIPGVLNPASGTVVAEKRAPQVSSYRRLSSPVLHLPPHFEGLRNIAVDNPEAESSALAH